MADKTPQTWPLDLDQEELTGDSGEQVGPILTDDALDIMREAVRGNGLDPAAVAFTGFTGETLHFEVQMILRVTPDIGRKIMPGKQRGEIVGSQTAAKEKITAAIAVAARNPDIREYAVAQLKRRLDLGFGLDGFALQLENARKTFVVHESCVTCHGHGATQCAACHGRGGVVCKTCHGAQSITCPACRGMKYTDGAGRQQPCLRCNLRGRVDCPGCRGSGSIPCRACKETGKADCLACQGTGWRSVIQFADFQLRGRFFYDPRIVPEAVLPILKGLRGEFVTARHGWAAIHEERERAKALDALSKDDEFAIPYDVRLPFGAIAFTLGAKPVVGELFGFHPSVINMPSFLAELGAEGLRQLDAAAAGAPGAPAVHLHDAARFRFIADAIQAADRFAAGRARKLIERRYPTGLRAPEIRHLMARTQAALRRAGRNARYGGLLAGWVFGAALDWLAMGSAAPAAIAVIFAGRKLPILSALLIFAGGGLAASLARFAEGHAVHKSLPGLSIKKMKFAPRLSTDIAIAVGGSLAIFLACSLALHHKIGIGQF